MKFLTTLLLLLLSEVAFARWAETSAAYIAVDYMKQNILVKEDGTSEMIGEVQAEFTNEAVIPGRSHFTQAYNKPVETFEILEAKTILPEGSISVPKEMIEDKPVASHGYAMEDLHQISVTFPSLRKGARIYVRYRSTNNQKIVPGYFSWFTGFRDGQYLKKWETTVTAPFPLLAEINDPWKNIESKTSRQGESHVITLKLKGPHFKYVVEEESALSLPNERPWVVVTSTRDWNMPYVTVSKSFEAEIRKPLPKVFADIAASVKKIPPGTALLNALTDQLGEKIRYVSDTRMLEGLLAPRSLSTVAEKGYGDCKDFATAIVAMVRHLGYDANIAIIEGSMLRTLPLGTLPSLSYFNHAIARVQFGDKVHWVDGTSDVSFAEGVPQALSDRNSLVLYPGKPKLEWVSSINPERSVWAVKSVYEISPKQKLAKFEETLQVKGSFALPYVGAERREEKLRVAYRILSGIENMARVRDWKFDDFDLSSRSYRDLNFRFFGTIEDPFLKTTAGQAISWTPSPDIQRLLMRGDVRVSHVELRAGRQSYETHITNTKLVGKPIHCEVKSKWFDGLRDVRQTPTGIRLVDDFVVKVHHVTHPEMKSAQFAPFKKTLETCFSNVAVLFKATPVKKTRMLAE